MRSSPTIAIDLGRRRLRAVEAGLAAGSLRVRRVMVEPVPEDLDRDDAAALGRWVGRALGRARFPKAAATFAVSREHVVMKRITLRTKEADELPEMARLELGRDLPFDADDAVIDFVTVSGDASSTEVLAVAVPQKVLTFIGQMATAAGLDIVRISLRNMGTAALIGSLQDRAERPGLGVLVVDITGERVELSVVVDGVIRFSRAGDLPSLDEPDRIAEAVVTETRRTWMSYRIVGDSNDVRRAVVIGNRAVSEQVAGSISEILAVETDVLAEHPLVDTDRLQMDSAWPLAGLLLEPQLGVESIDFQRPRRPPDIAGRRRRRVLVAGGLAVVVLGGGVTAARFDLDNVRREVASLESQRKLLGPPFVRYGRDLYRLAHLQQWETVDADWLGHLAYIVTLAPPPDRLVLDSATGSLQFDKVRFDRRSKRFSAPRQLRIVLEGEAVDRLTADSFRGSLVDTEAYEISTTGLDASSGRRLPFAFSYLLKTTDGSPPRSTVARGAEGAEGAGPGRRQTASRERAR
ncbi:MAG: pilus assembly protein PilM [Planctomycetes bacterium]|nr:pilus assembly protein PilM [Planctomycetota bacterium]